MALFFGSDIIWGRYKPFVILWFVGVFRYLHETTIRPLLSIMNSNHENKCTFVSPTFKVEEKNAFIFSFRHHNTGIWAFLWFQNVCSCVHYWITYHKMSKSSYLPPMNSDPKNMFFNLKVREIEIHLFSCSELILLNYGIFVVSQRYWQTPQKSQNDKKLISPSNDVWSKK